MKSKTSPTLVLSTEEIRQFFLRRRRLFDVTGQETAAARDRKCPVARLSQRDNTCKYNPAGFHGAFNVSRACGMDIARSCDTCVRLYAKFSGTRGIPDLYVQPVPFASRRCLWLYRILRLRLIGRFITSGQKHQSLHTSVWTVLKVNLNFFFPLFRNFKFELFIYHSSSQIIM